MVALTAAYTLGTFFLWWTTRRALRVTQDLFRLTLLVEYYRAQEPAPNVGHPWETREFNQKIEALGSRKADAVRRIFRETLSELGEPRPAP
jgi:hypothetical protein